MFNWPHMNSSKAISNKANHSYPIRENFHCKSTNVIYVMTWNVCNIQYDGETSNTMNNRWRGHESSIRTAKDHPVAKCYRSYNHTIDDYTQLRLQRKKYAEILLHYRQLFVKCDVNIGGWGIFGVEIFLRYSQIFVKGNFVIGRVECTP